MGILTALLPERRAIFEGPLPLTAARIVEWLGGPPTMSGAQINPEGALRIAANWACVRVIAEDVGKLPFGVFERTSEDGKQPAPNHPLYSVLHDRPNPHMTAMQFRETLQGHLLGWGNAYANIERDQDGRVRWLWPLRPDRMEKPRPAKDGSLLYLYRMGNGEPVLMPQADVLHIRGLSPDGISGYSPVALHRETLGWAMAIREYGARFFANDSRPGGVLQTDGKLSPEAASRLATSWAEAHRGVTNAHRVAVLEEGIKWQQVGSNPEDAQFLATAELTVQEICRIYRMPPHKVADLSRGTFSNIEEEQEEYVTDTLGSWLTRWEQQCNVDLLLPREQLTLYTKHNMNALLRSKTIERFQSYVYAIQNGIYSPNDVLLMEDMNTFEGGDMHLQPLNMVPWGTMPAPKPAVAAPAGDGAAMPDMVPAP